MSGNGIQRVQRVGRVRDEYIIDNPNGVSLDKIVGWTKGTIDRFEESDDGEQINMILRTPWGYETDFNYDVDEIFDSHLANYCDEYGVPVGDFMELAGNDIWIKVHNLKYKEEDDIVGCGMRLSHEYVVDGPEKTLPRSVQIGILMAAGLILSLGLFAL